MPFTWEIYIESPDGRSSGTINSSWDTTVYPVKWSWEQKFDVLAANLSIEFADAAQFFVKWDNKNPLSSGSLVKLILDGVVRFTGRIWEPAPKYSADDRSLSVKCYDRAGSLDQACMKEKKSTRVKYQYLNLYPTPESGSIVYLSQDWSGSGTSPWADEYVIPLWSGTIGGEHRLIPLEEYTILHEIGGIAFRNSMVHTVGDTTSGSPATDFSGSLSGRIAYYDQTDTSMRVSQILMRAFIYYKSKGGLGWTNGVDFILQDTPTDKVNRMHWITDEGDGYISDFISWLYDNAAVGLAPSYQIHDFDGLGVVEGRLITQNSGSGVAKDIDTVYDSDFPSDLRDIYSRAVLLNNDTTRHNIIKDKLSSIVQMSSFPSPPFVQVGVKENTIDGSSNTAFGFWEHGEFAIDAILPEDVDFLQYNFSEDVEIDTIQLCARYFYGSGTPIFDNIGAFPTLKMIYTHPIYTIWWNIAAGPEFVWFPLHPDLFYFAVDPVAGRDSWKIVEDIGVTVRNLKVVINVPMFAKSGEDNQGNADRVIVYYLTDFKVLRRGRIVDLNTNTQPEISFSTSGEPDLIDLAGNPVVMNRPVLVEKLICIDLPKKTLIVEADDVHDFSGSGSIGSRLLATELDFHSRQNDWSIEIKPRADLYLGDTVFFSRLNPDAFYTLKGFTMAYDGSQLGQMAYMSNYEQDYGGEAIV